jgi:hypothetical protein
MSGVVRLASSLLALIVLLGQPAARPGQTVGRPFVGITAVDRVETLPRPVHMRVVQIDTTAEGIRFKLSPPRGGREVVRERTLEYLEREDAQIGINAHYFLPFPSTDTEAVLIGIAASEGRVYSGFEQPAQSYALVADAPGINIEPSNRASLVHRNRAHADGFRIAESVGLWTTVSGSAQIVKEGVVTIPEYRDETRPDALLVPGGPNNYSNSRSWYEAINARTAIGLSADRRTVTLFTVDARGGSGGLTVREVAHILARDYGVYDALNLDGGGSTSLAMQDPVSGARTLVNTSSDSPAGRSVGSSLVVFARGPH